MGLQGRNHTYRQISYFSRSILAYECALGQMLYHNCLLITTHPSVMQPDICRGITGQMMVTFVMQVLSLAYLREVYKVQIKQQKCIFSLEFYRVCPRFLIIHISMLVKATKGNSDSWIAEILDGLWALCEFYHLND